MHMARARPEWQQEWPPGLWWGKLAQCFGPQAKQPICLYLIYSAHSWGKDTKLDGTGYIYSTYRMDVGGARTLEWNTYSSNYDRLVLVKENGKQGDVWRWQRN